MATPHPPLPIRARQLKWTARALFAAAVAWMVIAWWPTRHRLAPPPQEPVRAAAPGRTDWARIEWTRWQDRQSGKLEYRRVDDDDIRHRGERRHPTQHFGPKRGAVRLQVKDKALMDQIIKAAQDLVAMEVTLDGRTITGFKVLKGD